MHVAEKLHVLRQNVAYRSRRNVISAEPRFSHLRLDECAAIRIHFCPPKLKNIKGRAKIGNTHLTLSINDCKVKRMSSRYVTQLMKGTFDHFQ